MSNSNNQIEYNYLKRDYKMPNAEEKQKILENHPEIDPMFGIADLIYEFNKFIPTKEEEKFINSKLSNEIIQSTLNRMRQYKPCDYDCLIERGEAEEDAEDFEEILVEGNVKNIDNNWKKNKHYYLQPYTLTAKYYNSKVDILNEKVNTPPVLGVETDDKSISFVNGRHRFANLRDSGVKTIPIVINKKDLKNFKKLGYVNLLGGKRKTNKLKRNNKKIKSYKKK